MFTFPGGRREYGCSSEFRYSVSIGSFSSRSGQLRSSRWWFGSPRFSVPYTNTRRSALWAILARSLSDVFARNSLSLSCFEALIQGL
ncbi:AGAP010683-PA [Anopheles gambiae str. PEST]|nr:AGAP010683-PA [Anopheles gambiae str. PEST]